MGSVQSLGDEKGLAVVEHVAGVLFRAAVIFAAAAGVGVLVSIVVDAIVPDDFLERLWELESIDAERGRDEASRVANEWLSDPTFSGRGRRRVAEGYLKFLETAGR